MLHDCSESKRCSPFPRMQMRTRLRQSARLERRAKNTDATSMKPAYGLKSTPEVEVIATFIRRMNRFLSLESGRSVSKSFRHNPTSTRLSYRLAAEAEP